MATQVATIRVFKNLNGVGSRGEYSDTYHVTTAAALDSASLATTASELAHMEAKFATSNVTFTRATVSGFTSKKNGGDTDQGQEVVLGFNGFIIDAPGQDGISRLLPAESCIVVKRAAGKRAGRPTYRHSIATQDWTGTGEGVKLTQAKIDQVNNALATYMEQINATNPLVKPSKGVPTGLPGKPVTKMTCAGTQNRQVTQKRDSKKKEDDWTTPPTTPDGLAKRIQQADDILRHLDPALALLGATPAEQLANGKNALQAGLAGIQLYRLIAPALPALEQALPALAAAAL